ncbi:zinc finger protein 37-like isoform X2 [Mercenaria mercenaria]|uniref:zinc finger protein 37-like isoform X2 n=1 Tax=Mercenaria mercenaria TaxID=6596 RepID=UPI00234E4FED|nr:zinc finger protein 37-like isoform X2 [Mercenaria mercenaria]
MNQYLLTLMVTFEQEYAIQKLFGRHGWEYSKISGDISLKNIELEETSAAVNQQVSQNTTEKTDTCSKDTRAAADTANDNQGTASGESAVNNHVNNIFNNSVTQHHDAHCGGEDGNNGNNCGGDTDTGESLESLGIVVKEEVESCDEDETFEHNLDNINDTSSKVENSGKDKRGAKCKLKVNSVIKKRRKERASSDINEEVAGGKSEFKLEELSPGDQEINDPLAVLETLPNIEHVSKVGLPHDVETFLTDANDVDDSGFSATLSAYFCKDCGHTFPEEKYYILHKRSGKCVFPCQSCDKKFTFKNFSKYQEHLKQHRLEDILSTIVSSASPLDSAFSCAVCNKTYMSKYSLSRHVKVHTAAEFKCLVCSKEFHIQSSYKQHLETHQGDKHLCSECGKSFCRVWYLNQHIRTAHQNDYPYVCNICGRKFSKNQHLEGHNVKHHKAEKMYACTKCHKKFTYKSTAHRHEKVCLGSAAMKTEYTCEVCNKAFVNKKSIRQHMILHSEPKHICDSCGKTFIWRTSYKVHCNLCTGSF